MLLTKAANIKRMKKHPGVIMVIGEDSKDVYIVDVYKMMI
jgi:hypothetical protein